MADIRKEDGGKAGKEDEKKRKKEDEKKRKEVGESERGNEKSERLGEVDDVLRDAKKQASLTREIGAYID